MLWNFQYVKITVKCLDKHVEQADEKAGVKSRRKGFEKNEYACSVDSVEGVFLVSDWTAPPYLKVAGPTRKITARRRK